MANGSKDFGLSLLSQSQRIRKKDVLKTVGASFIFNYLDALTQANKQKIVDNVEDIKREYNNLFAQNRAEFLDFQDERNQVEEYLKNKDVFLNKNVTNTINNTNTAQETGVTWESRFSQPDEVRQALELAFNEERNKLDAQMKTLVKDPRVVSKSFEDFNKFAEAELDAALKLVRDDPRKKSIVRNLFNRIFKTTKDADGNLISTNKNIILLENNLKDAKRNRQTFRDQLNTQIIEKSDLQPLVFKSKPIDLENTIAKLAPELLQTFGQLDKYKNLDAQFFAELISDTAEEEGVNQNNIENKVKTKLLLDDDIDTTEFLTRRGLLLANGEALIDSFEQLNPNEHRTFLSQGSNLLKLIDAYSRDGQEAIASDLLNKYKDINKNKQFYEPSTTQLVKFAEEIRLVLDPKADKQFLKDNNAIGIASRNAALSVNYFMNNNPNWRDTYSEAELNKAGASFVLTNIANNKPLRTELTNADLISYRINPETFDFDLALIDEIPDFIKELKNANRESDIQDLYEVFTTLINNNQSKELTLDDKEALLKNIETIFSDEIDSNNVNILINKQETNNPLTENIPVSTNEYVKNNLIDYHVGRKRLFLSNFEKNIEDLDFSNFSYNELGYLAGISNSEIKQYLGLSDQVGLTKFRFSHNIFNDKAFDALQNLYAKDYGYSDFTANGYAKSFLKFQPKQFRFRDVVNQNEQSKQKVQTFFENLKNKILNDSLPKPPSGYNYYISSGRKPIV